MERGNRVGWRKGIGWDGGMVVVVLCCGVGVMGGGGRGALW